MGYLIERGLAVGNEGNKESATKPINMVRLFGRCPRAVGGKSSDHSADTETLFGPGKAASETRSNTSASKASGETNKKWSGSIHGSDWDERVGAGAGPSSIVSSRVRI